MNVVVAPDKFKGCLTAAEVAAAVADGLRAGRRGVHTHLVPVADGGDGTVAAALAAGYQQRFVEVEGPTGVLVRAPYGLRGRTAVVELAAACGLERLPGGRFDPLGASTYGLGQVVGHAVDAGATEVVIGLGGSASTDGGAGLVQALGARLLDGSGVELGRGGGALPALRHLDLTVLRRRLTGVRLRVAVDVDHPLLGPRGAAAVFGPQKGADAGQVAALEAGLASWADVVARATGADLRDRPGTGAAGGTAFAAVALLGADLRPGIGLVLDLVGFDRVAAGAALVVTGEGSLDEQSLAGKAPVVVAGAAARFGVPTVAVAGRTLLSAGQLRQAGIRAAYPLSDLEPNPAVSMRHAADLLHRTGVRIARRELGPWVG